MGSLSVCTSVIWFSKPTVITKITIIMLRSNKLFEIKVFDRELKQKKFMITIQNNSYALPVQMNKFKPTMNKPLKWR
jgi:hypothetical protein